MKALLVLALLVSASAHSAEIEFSHQYSNQMAPYQMITGYADTLKECVQGIAQALADRSTLGKLTVIWVSVPWIGSTYSFEALDGEIGKGTTHVFYGEVELKSQRISMGYACQLYTSCLWADAKQPRYVLKNVGGVTVETDSLVLCSTKS